MRKTSKHVLLLSIYFFALAVILGMVWQNSAAQINSQWKSGEEIGYQFPSSIPNYENKSTFRIEGVNQSLGTINTSRDGRIAEPFPFIFTEDNITTWLTSTNNGTPSFGQGNFGGKNITWVNKTDILSNNTLQSLGYLASYINVSHQYYYVIDVASGVTLVLGDATDGTQLMILTRWPDSFINWDLIFTIVMALAAFLVFIGVYRYAMRELRIAPKDTKSDRLRTYLSSTIFAMLIVGVVLFILTIVLTGIAENWKLALNFGVPVPQGGTYVNQPLSPGWQAEIGLIEALEWPTFIPITTVLIGIYIIIYPFFEMAFMMRRGSDAPTEIQQKLESNVIDRLPRPLNIVAGSGYMFIIYLVPTYLLYAGFLKYIPGWQDLLQLNLLLVAIVWFTIPALFFLNYYASFGITTMFWTSVSKGFKSKKVKDNLLNMIIIGIALILLFSTGYNFITNTVGLIRAGVSGNPEEMLPSIILQNPSGGTQILLRIFQSLIQANPFLSAADKATTIASLTDFFAIFPIDLLVFFLTVCVVGLWGFYSKFLSKEPLNRPILVLFASYIIGAIGVNVFINVILRFPNAYPAGFLVPAFTNPNNYAYGSAAYMNDYWNHFAPLRLLFFIPYYANFLLMFVFVVYNVLGNKELKQNIKETVFNFGIQNNRIDILTRYTNSPKQSTQLAVIDNIYRIVKSKLINPSQSIPALMKMISSPSPDINSLAVKTLRRIAKDYPINIVEPVFLAGIQSDSDLSRQNIGNSIVRIGRKQPEKIIQLYNDIITADLPIASQGVIVTSLEELNATNPEILVDVVLPMLDNESSSIRIGVLRIAKRQVSHLRAKSAIIIHRLLQLTKQGDEEESGEALEILGTLGAFDPAFADQILQRMDELLPNAASLPIRQKIVFSTLNLMVALPPQIDEFLPRIASFLKDPEEKIRAEVGTTLRSVGVALAASQIFTHIEKILLQILSDQSEEVRAQGAGAIAVIGKANSDLLQDDPNFINMVETILKDPSETVRKQMVELFTYHAKVSPNMIIYYMLLKTISENPNTESRRTLFEIFADTVEYFPKTEDINLILNPVLSTDRTDDIVRLNVAKILHQISRTRTESLNTIYPVLSILVKDKDGQVVNETVTAIGDIALEKVSNPQLMPDISLGSIIDLCLGVCQNNSEESCNSAVKYISNIYNVKPDLSSKIYPILLALQTKTDPNIIKRVIPLLTNIVCSNKKEYAPQIGEHLVRGNWTPPTKFNSEFLPALKQMMKIEDTDVIDALSQAMNTVVKTFPEATQELGDFLKHTLDPKQKSEIRVVTLAILGGFTPVLEEPQLIKVLVHATRRREPEEIRAKVLDALGAIIDRSRELYLLDPVYRKRARRLIHALFKTHFLKDPRLKVRRDFATTLVSIAKKQPSIEKTYYFLRDLVLDEDEQISMIAIRGFFAAINLYPHKIAGYASFFRGFGRSHHLKTRQALKEEIQFILNKTGKMEQVLPTILFQAGDENPDVRRAAFEDFKHLIETHPKEIDYFRSVLIKLMHDKKKTSREDVIPSVVTLLKKNPKLISSTKPVFQSYLDLSRDPIEDVRFQMLLNLKDLLKLVQANQINLIFQALFQFIREDNRQFQDNAVECFQILVERFPARIPDMLRDLVKINRREENVLLTQLIQEMNEIEKKEKKKHQ